MTGSLVRIVAACVVTLGAVGSAAAQNCRWTDPLPLPSKRIGESMAYDSARGVCVLFGGIWGPRQSGETWVWDGLDWVHRSVVGPSPRASHKMAYDSDREVVVLFGGIQSSPFRYFGDTWEWDGERWLQRASTGPPARRFHAMAYDSARGVTVVYGGFGASPGAVLDDTWEWDGNTWERIAQTGPSLSDGVEMAYDAHRGVLVLHGCSVASGEPQTWEWDGLAWTNRGVVGVACLFQEMAYDSARRVIVLSTGNHLWEYDGTNWTQRVTSPSTGGSATFAFAYDSRRGVTVLWESLTPWRTAEWDGTAWSYPLRARPPEMVLPAMVYDENRSVSVLVGIDFNVQETETWEWDGAEWELRSIGGPSARTGHVLAYDSARHVTTLFGGEDASGVGETWEWDGLAWTMVANTGPSPRTLAAMSYDEVRGVTVLTGGRTAGFSSWEVWEWDGTMWTQRGWLPDGPLSQHSMAFDKRRNVTVVSGYGGWQVSGTWEYDGQAWTKRSSMFVSDSSMIFDEKLGAIVAVVGNEMWIWDGSTWSAGPSNASIRGIRTEAAYDIARDRTVIFVNDISFVGPTTVLEYGCDCYADCDQSGMLDIFDFLCFQNGFILGDPAVCNCDTSTGTNVCDIFDFLCFQSAFVGGCP